MSLPVSLSRPVVGVVGAGVVGTHLCVDLVARGYAVSVYDTDVNALATVVGAVPGNRVRACASLCTVCETCQMLFVAIPIPVIPATVLAASCATNGPAPGYQLDAVHATMAALVQYAYTFPVLLKCTMCPGTTDALSQQYSSLWLFHVPEFLSSQTAAVDTLSPTQPLLLLGVPDGNPVAMAERVRVFLEHCTNGRQRVMTMRARETEATKLFCNVFYAAKVQVFNEFHALCGREGVSYDLVRHAMLQQGWMHPMHTQVPGPNGVLGFGGACLPKDATALAQWAGPACPMLTRLGQTPSARGHPDGA
jgi:UDP-glucose 6-dehydrogenase